MPTPQTSRNPSCQSLPGEARPSGIPDIDDPAPPVGGNASPEAFHLKTAAPLDRRDRRPTRSGPAEGSMRFSARLQRDGRFMRGLNRTLKRVKSIARESDNLICDDLQEAVEQHRNRP